MFPENKLDSRTPPLEKICKSHFEICVFAQSSDRKNTVGGKRRYCGGSSLVLSINSLLNKYKSLLNYITRKEMHRLIAKDMQ